MGQVISIERSPKFGVTNTPYAGFNMSFKTSDSLVMIKLPIGEDQAPADVLAQVIGTSAGACQAVSVLIDDSESPNVIRQLVGSTSIAAIYDPRPLGSMDQFCAQHEHEIQQIVLAGGASYGGLTIARAAHAMKTRGLSPEAALDEALAVGQNVRKLEARLQNAAGQLAALAA